MSVWYAIPSRKIEKDKTNSISKWKEKGYNTAVYLDPGFQPYADFSIVGVYEGYAKAVNILCHEILQIDKEANIVVTGGDDVYPDENHSPKDLETEFLEHFHGTLGVMQPTGDRWMIDAQGKCSAERVCYSPWMGREFIERINGGTGPIWHEYFHFYEDEELHEVATKLGILWHRPDLSQYHDHWLRRKEKQPAYLSNARYGWDAAKKLFDSRKASGFPGHQLLVS